MKKGSRKYKENHFQTPLCKLNKKRSTLKLGCFLAGEPGFEPRYHPPEGCVLPLDDPAIGHEGSALRLTPSCVARNAR